MSSFLKNDVISHPPVEEKDQPILPVDFFKEMSCESPASTEKKSNSWDNLQPKAAPNINTSW